MDFLNTVDEQQGRAVDSELAPLHGVLVNPALPDTEPPIGQLVQNPGRLFHNFDYRFRRQIGELCTEYGEFRF